MGVGRGTSNSIIHADMHKSNNKLISAKFEHFWCYDKPKANSNSQDSPWPRLGGSHHLPPYSILCASPRGPYPNGILSRDSQMGVPKFSKLRLLQLWGPITLCAYLRLRWSSKKICSTCRELSNGMLHATCTQGNQINSKLLMVRSQIGNLTLDLSFGNNLCFKCPNGSCELILDIYILITFQLYKEIFNPLDFDPCNRSLKFRESIGTPNSQSGSSLGSVRVHSLTLSFTPRLHY
jgi:hypothetical protein